MSNIRLPTTYHKLEWYERKAVREEYVKRQKNKCMRCGFELDLEPPSWVTDYKIDWSLFPEGFLKHPVHLQHDHKTGLTEGAVHAYCNAYMWQYEGR